MDGWSVSSFDAGDRPAEPGELARDGDGDDGAALGALLAAAIDTAATCTQGLGLPQLHSASAIVPSFADVRRM